MINLHGQEAVTNFLTALVHRHFRKCKRKNDLWWWLNLLGNACGKINKCCTFFLSFQSVPCGSRNGVGDSSWDPRHPPWPQRDAPLWREWPGGLPGGSRLPAQAGRDQLRHHRGGAGRWRWNIIEYNACTNFYCSGTYNCYSNNSLVAKVDLILKENVPFSESNSAQQNSEDNSDSDYLRWEQLTWQK